MNRKQDLTCIPAGRPTELVMGGGLVFPPEAVTETFLILGKRGAGKTNTAVVLAEEMIGAGLRTCIIDPTGVWWGLRSSADGQHPGLPVIIFGGEHADLPLPPDAGAAMADLIVDEPDLVCVLDLKLMSKTVQRRFMTDFLERIYHRNRDPLHLIVDEADLFAPMRATQDIARLLGAYEDVVRRGRANGLGSTSITQRPSGMHTDIRSQPEVLLTLRLIGKHDINAVDEWVRLHADEDQARELKQSLPSLPVGTAWVWSPGWLDLLERVQIRPRRTFDSSSTPKVGQRRIMPRAFAQVDVAALQARMATVTGQATTADPAALRARIGQLERDLSSARSGAAPAALAAENASLREQLAAARARPPQIIEMPVLQAGEVAAVEQVITALQDMAGQLRRPADQLAAALAAAGRRIPAALPVTDPPAGYPPPDPGTGTDDQEDPAAGPLRRGERKMLEVMARMYPLQLTQPQLGTLAGFAASGGTFGNYLRTLRRRGLAGVTGKHVLLTAAGQAVTGPATLAPVTAQEIRDMWAGPLRAGERAMLDVLIARYPGPVTPAELAEATGFAAAGGTFGNYLRTLKRNGLAEEVPGGIRADSVFFLDPAGV